MLYEGLHPGGFGQVFELPKEFAIDLRSAIQMPAEEKEEGGDHGKKGALTADHDQTVQIHQLDSRTQSQQDNSGRRRFGLFRSNRADSSGHEESQIEMTNQPHDGQGQNEGEEKEEKKTIEQGMRVLIRIDGVGPQGRSIISLIHEKVVHPCADFTFRRALKETKCPTYAHSHHWDMGERFQSQ